MSKPGLILLLIGSLFFSTMSVYYKNKYDETNKQIQELKEYKSRTTMMRFDLVKYFSENRTKVRKFNMPDYESNKLFEWLYQWEIEK